MRELGGEVWAEIENVFSDDEIDWQRRTAIVDLVMGVLARHVDSVLVNDADLPVAPLPSSRDDIDRE